MLLETEILNRYKSGLLKGIYISDVCFYMPIRITGTGNTIRLNDDNNLVVMNRDSSAFLSSEVVNACSNLPILIDHPANGENKELLSYTNITNNPIIGQTIYAYVENESEIWAIARIYDLTLLDKLDEYESTSPAVFSENIEDNGKVDEIPRAFNHIAFVIKGHWDQVSDKAYDISQITLQGEDVKDEDIKSDEDLENIKSDEDLKDKVEGIEEAEKEEAQHFKEMSEEHSEALDEENKGDINMNEISKLADEETEIVDEETEVADEDTEVVDEEEETKKVDEDTEVVDDEEETDEDKDREELIETMTELSDSLDESVGFKKVYVSKREKPSVLISRILKANKNLLDSKYSSLSDDKSYSNYLLKVDAFNNVIENALKAQKELQKNSLKNSRGKWERLDNGVSVDPSF